MIETEKAEIVLYASLYNRIDSASLSRSLPLSLTHSLSLSPSLARTLSLSPPAASGAGCPPARLRYMASGRVYLANYSGSMSVYQWKYMHTAYDKYLKVTV